MNNPVSAASPGSPLPYSDTKPVGAADFYFVINATFRFILQKYGREGLRGYWTDLGTSYCKPITVRWRQGGLAEIAAYWKAFFAAEPGAEVDVEGTAEAVLLNVRTCPAIAHLRKGGREIVPCFCEHCYFISQAMAQPAGFTVRIEGGNGRCHQTFQRASIDAPRQQLSAIEEVKC